jgi:hypothetical protein
MQQYNGRERPRRSNIWDAFGLARFGNLGSGVTDCHAPGCHRRGPGDLGRFKSRVLNVALRRWFRTHERGQDGGGGRATIGCGWVNFGMIVIGNVTESNMHLRTLLSKTRH